MDINREELRQKLTSFMRETFKKDSWMTDDEYNEMMTEALAQQGTSIDHLVDQLIIGINNGYTPEYQFELLRKAFTK
jgi:hypothetical protein